MPASKPLHAGMPQTNIAMKAFNLSTVFRLLCLTCLVACCGAIHAQVLDSVQVDSTNASQALTKPRPRPRAFVFGQVSTSKILTRMPQYLAVQKNLKALKEQYEAEAKKSENDFQRKFEEFMQGQKEFPKTILEKRQNELQNMLETNASFRIKVQALLKEAEKSMMADVKAELNDAITIAAQDRGISIVYDLDGGSVPYIVPGLATDITTDVIKLLGIEDTVK